MEKLRQDLLNNGKKLIFGSDVNLKLLKNDKLERIYLAKNCKENVREAVKRYITISGTNGSTTEIVELNELNDEIGIVCKKPFSVSVIGLGK